MSKPAAKEWIVMHCLEAFRASDGGEGQHKVPLEGFDTPNESARP